ncbi:unnamed protein product [Prorocentrum cordatum]|uniref:RING-type domain-containing protein n=1 Tax=Prorocentrum cordatum TaxID=2364126 RepID=A0ABN9XP85_9DINO|nr:unnamed protein product [Polarella glacialis]
MEFRGNPSDGGARRTTLPAQARMLVVGAGAAVGGLIAVAAAEIGGLASKTLAEVGAVGAALGTLVALQLPASASCCGVAQEPSAARQLPRPLLDTGVPGAIPSAAARAQRSSPRTGQRRAAVPRGPDPASRQGLWLPRWMRGRGAAEEAPTTAARHRAADAVLAAPGRADGAALEEAALQARGARRGPPRHPTPERWAPPGPAVAGTINALPTHRVTAREATCSAPEHRSCTICLEEFSAGDTQRMLPCFHRFHQHCVDRWLHVSGCCPNCKTRIARVHGVPDEV